TVSEDNSELVGIENPCQSIIKLLTHGDEEELKMVSICGTGGLGKTTVAHAVYRKIANEFKYNFFVDMPRNLDIKVIIGTICAEVGCPRPKFEECGVQQLVDRLKIFFEGKRCVLYLLCYARISYGNQHSKKTSWKPCLQVPKKSEKKVGCKEEDVLFEMLNFKFKHITRCK
uniref:NB-ARC domain-containing protein n=1 Tax=Aegilops tauschii subsp. strangulata TaxID=200361 RepID=A0A453LZ81_AEGTS